MQLLDEKQAECLSGGRASSGRGRAKAPVAVLLRGSLGLNTGLSPAQSGLSSIGSTAIDTTVNQVNLALNFALNGGSIVNNQLNGLDLSVSA
jgi:hypothetical protein